MARILQAAPTAPASGASSSGALPPLQYASPQDNPATPNLGGQLRDAATGFTQATLKPLMNTGAAIESGLDETVGRGVNIATGKGNVPSQSGAKVTAMTNSPAMQTPPSLGGKIGNAAGVIAPYLLGAGEQEAGMAGSEVTAKTGSKVLGGLAKAAVRTVPNTAIGTAQTKSLKQGAITGVTASVGQGLLEGAGSIVKGALSDGAKSMKAVGAAEAKTQSVIDNISPKIDAKQTKLALKEGRILPGQDATLLKDGTKDQILPSDKTVKAAQTIQKNIPDAHTMSQPQLHVALGDKVKEISTKIRPEMEKTPVSDQVVENITNSWNALKQKQLSNDFIDPSINVQKFQDSFEKNFLQKSGSQNMADLWDTRIAYDNSIPQNVKDATALSSDRLQDLKSMWLQNRAILNGAINDTATGLGKTSQKAFSDMSDLYNAQKGIESSYKVPKDGAISGLKKFQSSTGGKLLEGALGGTVAYETAKKLGVPLP